MRELPNTKEYEPYDLSLTLDKRFLFKNGKFAPFTLHDLIQINYSYHYECYSISELSDEYGISFDVIKRILSRYQKGDFDKFINDEYFKDLNEGELKNHYSRFEDFLKGKSADFTSLTMKGYSIAKSCEISNLDIEEVESWLLKGEKGLKPYDIFYDAFLESKEQLLDEKAPLLIENIESGHSLAKASQMADLSINEVKMWIEKGHGKIEPYADFYKDKQEDPEYVSLSIGLDTDEILAVAPIFRCFLKPFCMASGTDALMSNVLVSSCMSRYETMDRSENVDKGDFHASVTLSYMFNGKIPRDESIYHFIHISLLAQALLVLGDCPENSNIFKKVSKLLDTKEKNK